MDENLSSKRYEPHQTNPVDKSFSPTLLKEIEYTGEDKTVLEIGTSTGFVSKILKERGNRITGIELDDDAGSVAQHYCDRMIIGDVETLDFDTNFRPASFDVIVCGDVLEHLKKPATLLKKLRKFLKPDGYLVISLPNFCHGDVLLNLLNGDFHTSPMGLLDETHLHFFGLKNIYTIFTDCGYQIRDLHTTHAGIGTTELKVDETRIPGDLLLFIRSLPESTAYQYVFRAYPTDTGIPPVLMETDINTLFLNSLKESEQRFQAPLVETITKLNASLAGLERHLLQRVSQIEELERQVLAGTEQIAALSVRAESLDLQLTEKTSRLEEISARAESLNRQLTEKTSRLQEVSVRAESLDHLLTEKTSQLNEREKHIQSLSGTLSLKENQIQDLTTTLSDREQKLTAIEQSIIWQCTMKFHAKVIERLLPQNTTRRKYYDLGLKSGKILFRDGFHGLIREYKMRRAFLQACNAPVTLRKNEPEQCKIPRKSGTDVFPAFINNSEKPLTHHAHPVDIIVCVHNAYEDVKKCLESVIRYSSPPFSVILVDDGSEDLTRVYLEEFAKIHGALLIRNSSPRGYTSAANQGLKISKAPYVILLNSDTIVTCEWLDRIVECAESEEKIGLVGPLSNTASWQSVPAIEEQGDWAKNNLPRDISVQQMGRFIAKYSARTYPKIPFINGFCLFIKRTLIDDIGYFDEENFGKGYGEENDYCIRAKKAGWMFAIADDVYIFHSQSRSYSDEKRKKLCERSDQLLREKHGPGIIMNGVAECRHNAVLTGIRARTRAFFDRWQIVLKGRNQFESKRILVILPVCDQGGGSYVVIQECRAMMEMGVDIRLFNLALHKSVFEKNFPDLTIPVIYGTIEDLTEISDSFDAIICTTNVSVSWVEHIPQKKIIAYYVQDFEPDFYPLSSMEYRQALQSYSKIPALLRFTKTRWTHDRVKEKAGVECRIIGPSVDIDLFRPLSLQGYTSEGTTGPVHITAMIRPSTPRRNPQRTLEILQEIKREYQDKVFIQTFGCSDDELSSMRFDHDFSFCHTGVLNRSELVALFNTADIFFDCSSFQAMGLTAFEAMACGAAVVVPENGGSKEVIRDGINGLIVDTQVKSVCLDALKHLISDDEFRRNLSLQAITDTGELFPERAAYNILTTIFGERDHERG